MLGSVFDNAPANEPERQYYFIDHSSALRAEKEIELGHAMTIHQFAAEDIEELKRVYPDVPMNQQHFLTFRLSLLHLFEKDCFLFLIL